MKKFIRLSLALGNSFLLQAAFPTPASAQVSTPSAATPTPTGTTSALPQAGTESTTLFLVLFGLLLLVFGVMLLVQQARESVRA